MQRLTTATTSQEALVQAAVACLKAGGLIIFPTETTYGAGVDATNPAAVAKLLAYKSRREGKPLSIAVIDQAMAEQYVELTDSARQVYQRFLPGPVTVVSQDKGAVAPGVASEFGTLGVRIPAYPLVIEIVKKLGKPLTATSANASDGPRPYTIETVLEYLSAKQTALIDLILDAGELPPNPPSTVIDTTHSTPVTFRQGSIELTTGSTTTLHSQSETETKAIAGKLMLKHWNHLKERGLVIGLDGSLGTGKTVFTKGIAAFLQIPDTITSPTYTYMEEYDWHRHDQSGQLFHLDLWKVGSEAELQNLELPKLLKPGNVIVIEWWSQVAQWLKPAFPQVVQVVMREPEPREPLTQTDPPDISEPKLSNQRLITWSE